MSTPLKKTIKILHMYFDLMNLYGDWANPAVIERELTARGKEAVIEKKSAGCDIDFSLYDFIYIGSGTERSQQACMQDLSRYQEALLASIEEQKPVLATGNSHELFGQAVTNSNEVRFIALGLLDFETVQLNTRVTGDCLVKANFLEEKLISFINRAGGSQKGKIERPFLIEPAKGANFKACPEGIKYKNLLGTYMTGPVLVRNPPLLQYFADIITGEPKKTNTDDPFFKHQEKAYKTALDLILST